MSLENISLQSFRNMVQDAKVLDGDIALIANGKENKGVDLVKVDFGGKFRRIFSATAGMKANDAGTNIAVKTRFLEVLKGAVNADTQEGAKFLSDAKEMLGLGGERANKPLSRMTVKLLLDRADGKAPSFTAKHLNSFLDRMVAVAQPMLIEAGVSKDLFDEKVSFLRSEINAFINKGDAEYLEKFFDQELTPEWAAKSVLQDIVRENKAGALAEAAIDQSKYQFDIKDDHKPKESSYISDIRGMFKSDGDDAIKQKKDIDDFDLKVSLRLKSKGNEVKRDEISIMRENILDKKEDSEEVKNAVDFATKVIESKIGKEEFKAKTAGKTLTPSFMLDLAEKLSLDTDKGGIKKEELSEYIAKNDSSFVNSSELRSIMNDPKVKASMDKVSISAPKYTQPQKVRNFFADLVFSEDTWIHDGSGTGADKLRSALSKHADIIAQLNAQASGTYKGSDIILLGSFPLEPEMKIALKELLEGLKGAGTSAEEVRSAIKNLSDEQLNGFNDRIFAAGELACNRQQEHVTALFEKFASGGDSVGASNYSLDAPKDVLDKYIARNKGITGGKYGQFLLESIKMYFKSMPMIDKKAMFAASIRYAGTPDQKLAAFFKGAGPIFQKMLQGLPANFGDKNFRDAIADMKSRLAPIPQSLVKYQLAKIVADSKGKIADIKVDKSLGAATVGQAFLCTITDNEGNSRECVIKLLRPDAKMRALREKDIFFTAAEKTPGMREMFRSQYKGIMDELDLTKEADNIKKGDAYNTTGVKMNVNVGAMKLDPIAKPTTISLVVERAAGSTIDRLVEDVTKEVQNALGRLVHLDSLGNICYDSEHHVMFKSINMQSGLVFSEVQKIMDQAYQKIHKAQEGIVNASKVWTQEALYGTGVVHGDMHAGNIMVKDGKITIIDFGNSTQITGDNRQKVIGFSATTTLREPGDAVRVVASLLPEGHSQIDLLNKAAEKYDAIRSGKGVASDYAPNPFDSMMEKLHEALQFDANPNGNEDKDVGRRLTAALKIMQNAGVEIPAYLLTFMQSQDRLEATVNSLNDLMRFIADSYKAIAKGRYGDIHSGSLLDVKLNLAKAIYNFKKDNVNASVEKFFSDIMNGSFQVSGNDDYLTSLELNVYKSFGHQKNDEESKEIARGKKLLSAQKFKDVFSANNLVDGPQTSQFLRDIAPLLHHNSQLREELHTTILDKLDEFVANNDDEGFTKAVRNFAKKMKTTQTEGWNFVVNYLVDHATEFGLTQSNGVVSEDVVTLYDTNKTNNFGQPEFVEYKIDKNKFSKAMIVARDKGVFGPKPEVVLPEFKDPKDFLDSLGDVVIENKGTTMAGIKASVGFTRGIQYIGWAAIGKNPDSNKTIKMRKNQY